MYCYFSKVNAIFSLYLAEPPLFNFGIGVSNSDQVVTGFDPSMFAECSRYMGNVMSGQTLHIECDQIHTGRYLMLYIIGDGFTGKSGVQFSYYI